MKKSKEFQYLVELVDIVNRHKVKQIEVIGNPKSSHIPISRYWEFYEQMADGNFKDDRDAIEFFELKDNERSYKKLRLGLQSRLLNTLFFINLNSEFIDNYASIYQELWKKYATLMFLQSRGAITLCVNLAIEIFKIAQKYQFTELVYLSSDFIKNMYSMDSTKIKEYDKYNKIMWRSFEIKKVEQRAFELYEQSIIPYISKKAPKEYMTKRIIEYVKELSRVSKELRSEQFLRIYYLLQIYIPLTQYNWNKTIKIATEAITYYQENQFFPKRIMSVFLQQRILARIMIKDYPRATEDILLALKYMPKHSKGWFKLKELETMIYFYSGDYKSAWNLTKASLKHKRFDSLSEANKETWYIYNAYISFVQLIGKVDLSPREKGAIKQFRLSKFLNEVPLFSRDKQGMNISILIVQVLILLAEDKFDELDAKIDALMKYKQRKLSDISMRTGYFLKMIQCLKRGNYFKDKVVHKATSYFEKLNTIELDISNQGMEFEVIPYPILWGFIQEILSK